MPTIQVDIVSAEGEIFSGEAKMVYAPARMGEVGIAPRHAPLLTALKPGEVRVEDLEGKEHFFYITGGMLEIQPHLVTVLADTALRGKQLDEAAALKPQSCSNSTCLFFFSRKKKKDEAAGLHNEVHRVIHANSDIRSVRYGRV